MNLGELSLIGPSTYFYDVAGQLKDRIYEWSNRLFLKGDSERDKITSVRSLRKRQKFIRNAFINSIGGLDFGNSPLNACVVGRIKCDGFSIEKVIFESRPKVYVTANLYVPDGITSPRGAVLFVCGHHARAKHEPEYQIVCQHLVKAGLVVLAQDPVGQGERFSYYEKRTRQTTVACCCPEHDYAGSQSFMLGGSIARYFLHDAMRGIDYLCTRPEVDPGCIGVTGNSGGGTQTSMLMMADTRIAAAAPGTFIMNRQSYMYNGGAQDAEQIWPGLTSLGWDHEDIVLSMAPKPVMILAVSYDFFPIEGTRQTFERCKRIWRICGKPDYLRMVEDASVHKYTLKLAKAGAEFFARHLLKKKVSVASEGIGEIEPSLLWCTHSGQVRGEIAGARFVHEENIDRLRAIEKHRQKQSVSVRKKRSLAWLKQQVFSNREQSDLNFRIWHTEEFEDFSVQMCLWWSQKGIFNNGKLLKNTRFVGKELPLTIAMWDGGSDNLIPHNQWLRSICAAGRAVMVLDVSGEGAIRPNSLVSGYKLNEFYGVLHKLSDDLLWINDSMASMRVYDVIRCLDVTQELPQIKTDDVRVYACGRASVYAQLAAGLDGRIRKLEMVDGIDSFASIVAARHYNSYDIRTLIIPGILQYLDLPDVRKWIKSYH